MWFIDVKLNHYSFKFYQTFTMLHRFVNVLIMYRKYYITQEYDALIENQSIYISINWNIYHSSEQKLLKYDNRLIFLKDYIRKLYKVYKPKYICTISICDKSNQYCKLHKKEVTHWNTFNGESLYFILWRTLKDHSAISI